jgi:hypothetical protein
VEERKRGEGRWRRGRGVQCRWRRERGEDRWRRGRGVRGGGGEG